MRTQFHNSFEAEVHKTPPPSCISSILAQAFVAPPFPAVAHLGGLEVPAEAGEVVLGLLQGLDAHDGHGTLGTTPVDRHLTTHTNTHPSGRSSNSTATQCARYTVSSLPYPTLCV